MCTFGCGKPVQADGQAGAAGMPPLQLQSPVLAGKVLLLAVCLFIFSVQVVQGNRKRLTLIVFPGERDVLAFAGYDGPPRIAGGFPKVSFAHSFSRRLSRLLPSHKWRRHRLDTFPGCLFPDAMLYQARKFRRPSKPLPRTER